MDLRPSGVESVCNNINGPITVVCNLTWTSTNVLRWDVDPNGINIQTVFHEKGFNFSGKISNVGEIRLISMADSYIVTRLEVPDSQVLIPMTVTCGDGSTESEEHLLIIYKGKKCNHLCLETMLNFLNCTADQGNMVPDAPSKVSLQKDASITGYYILHWQTPRSSAPVDSYTINITAMSSQTFTTTTTNLSVILSNTTKYTVSLKATNCVGFSEKTVYCITTGSSESYKTISII